MAKKQGAIHEGSLADGWLKGFNQFMSELSMGETGPEAEKKRRLKRREMYPDMQAEEQKKQDSVRGEMFDEETQLPAKGEAAMTQADLSKRDATLPNLPARDPLAAAGRLLNPVRDSNKPEESADPFKIGQRAAGQSADQGGVHGGSIGEKPAADSETVAMSDTIADLQARLAKMELSAGPPTAPVPAPTAAETATIGDEFLKQAVPTGAGPAPPPGPQVDAFADSFKGGGQAGPPPPPPANVPVSRAGMAGGRRGIDQAVRAGNEKDVASGGGNRGLMAAIGGALGGAKDAAGGALGAITGGPKPPLKAQYKDLTNIEIARLERQGIDVYESPETDAFAQSFKGG
tara:strand:- start:801 stop:1838 length:1038 start_codon:yes stop_codon:yes gene_type:complete